MPKIITTEDFIKKAIIIHGNKYNYSKSIYINSKNKILIKDEYGFDHLVSPHVHLQGHKTSIKTVINKVNYIIYHFNLIHNYKYDYSKVKYDGKNKVTIICPEHGEFEQTPDSHLHGSGCPKCANLNVRVIKQKSNNEFINTAIFKHKNKYDYSLVNYINAKTKVKIICSIHGEFEQAPDSHLRGRGCPKCWSVNRKVNNGHRHTTNEFIEKSMLKHGNYYDYSKVKYTNGRDDVIIICPIHGEFVQQAKLHLRGNGCQICKQSKGEKEIMVWLQNNNIEYVPQYTFNDCRDKYPLPFDFYLPKYNTCIEFNGIQHYKPINLFGGLKALNKQIKHDKIKIKYCYNNKISLLIIKYNDNIKNNLEKVLTPQ